MAQLSPDNQNEVWVLEQAIAKLQNGEFLADPDYWSQFSTDLDESGIEFEITESRRNALHNALRESEKDAKESDVAQKNRVKGVQSLIDQLHEL